MTGTATPGPSLAPARRERNSGTPRHRRARGLPGTMGVTLVGAVLPGWGYLWTGRTVLGALVLFPTVAAAVAGMWYVGDDLRSTLSFVFDPTRLQLAAGILGGVLLLWLVVVVSTYAMVRPARRTRTQSVVGGVFLGLLCLTLASPLALGARYAWVQADLVETLFEDNRSATTPENATREDPWAGRARVNVLLLGGDGNVRRDGVRTDSMILASIDPATGLAVLFSLPRNMMNAQFPPDSPLHAVYPGGFTGDGGDPAASMLNAVYGQVPALHPGILGDSDNEGADALKQAVGGTLGVDVDYYVMVNLLGFRRLVDAMGGVTVNIDVPVPIGGNTDLGIPPQDYLQPGPDQRLDGFEALWFTRGRWGSDDYERMERQRCMIDAIIREARPWTLLRRFEALAATSKEIVRTDIPSDLMPAFVDLALRVKDAGQVRSVVFRRSDRFAPDDPDIAWMRSVVADALTTPSPEDRPGRDGGPAATPSAEGDPGATSDAPSAGTAVDVTDACAYDPGASASGG